jgi:starvation-inducible outer membrane lipoprotein
MSLRSAALSLAALALSACVSVPPDIQADMTPPDGTRPNNFGRFVDGPEGQVVRPDRATIAAVKTGASR